MRPAVRGRRLPPALAKPGPSGHVVTELAFTLRRAPEARPSAQAQLASSSDVALHGEPTFAGASGGLDELDWEVPSYFGCSNGMPHSLCSRDEDKRAEGGRGLDARRASR